MNRSGFIGLVALAPLAKLVGWKRETDNPAALLKDWMKRLGYSVDERSFDDVEKHYDQSHGFKDGDVVTITGCGDRDGRYVMVRDVGSKIT